MLLQGPGMRLMCFPRPRNSNGPAESHQNGVYTLWTKGTASPQFLVMTAPYPVAPKNASVTEEIAWRHAAYAYLAQTYEPGMVPAKELRVLGVYGGAAGFWGDKKRTSSKALPNGLCVGILHTGKSYADDVTSNHIFYHYPSTGRGKSGSTDINEIEAARAALKYRVPIFVILPGKLPSTREVRLGWFIADARDERVFVVEFADCDPGSLRSRQGVK